MSKSRDLHVTCKSGTSWSTMIFGCGLLTCIMPRSLAAILGDNDFRLDLGGGYSDNLTRAHTNPQAEAIGIGALNFAFAEERRRFSLDAVGDLAYLYYAQHTFPSQLVGGFDGKGLVKIIEEHFDWFVSDNFGQSRRDPFQPDTQQNLENINYLTTGPDFAVRMTSRLLTRLQLRYSRIDYQKSPLDNNRTEGTLSFIHQLTPVSNLSLNIADQNISFRGTAAAAPSYHREAAYLRLDSTQARTSLQADLGVDRLSFGGASFSGWLGRIDITHRFTQAQSVVLVADREYSNAGDVFRTLQNAGGVTLKTENVTGAADPFLHEEVGLHWQLNAARTLIDAAISHAKENYQHETVFNRTETGFSLSVRRVLSPRLSLLVAAYTNKEDFLTNQESFRDIDVSVAGDYRLGTRSGLTVRYEHLDRVNNVANNGLAENLIWISCYYGSTRTRHQLNQPGMQLIAWH